MEKNYVDSETVDITSMDNKQMAEFFKENGLSMKSSEARTLCKKLGRNPTLTELHIFNTEWSEHASYKTSRKFLKMLPTEGPNVILGPVEDSGIIELGVMDGEKYGVVVSHESHNHPSQVVPYEGAATGIGGILRDVVCMGAEVVATADPLRFGNPFGKNKNRTRYIANSVVDGIAGYGNPVGIPVMAGDLYFNDSFDDNCLVNVVCLGVVKEKNIIHSHAPKGAEGYDVIVVGKATDNSGFGGSAFASLILDEKDKESNKGAVQVPDPFLKNMLIRATYAVFEEARKQKANVGFKDMGAGGIMCATSELGAAGGYGIDLNLDKVHVSMNLPPYIIACSETQERFTWISPKEFTPTILKIYNDDFELPMVAEGARASVVGKVTKEPQYVVRHKGKIVCSAPIMEVTEGIKYDREFKKPKQEFSEPNIPEPKDYNEVLLNILKHQNICSRAKIYRHYDTEVRGCAVLRPGEADAGLLAPLPGKKAGIALSVDSNPLYARINPYKGAVAAVAEAMRNVAAIGAVPSGLTDCLNYGNPEKPEQLWQFVEGVKGVADAAKSLYMKGTKNPVPIVSGNVSFYNESAAGSSVDPSAVIACIGIMKDYGKAINVRFKKPDSTIYMLGKRKDELGGSVYYDMNKELGKKVPEIDFEKERNMIYAVIDAIEAGLVKACHDISDGGVAVALAEMCMGGWAKNNIGAEVDIESDLRTDKMLFGETSGFVLEADEKAEEIFKKHNVEFFKIGKTTKEPKLKVNDNIEVSLDKMKEAWTSGLGEALR